MIIEISIMLFNKHLPEAYFLNNPEYISPESSWIEHIPFAFFLIEFLKPDSFVELGTHSGVSFFAFCQAVKNLQLNTRCHAIDTWEGDKQAGYYGGKVYNVVAEINKQYSEFATLHRMTFDQALHKFPDKSIDLLHIDGLHTYEAVKHDYQCWLQKMSDKGIVLLHDTQEMEKDFGVWKFFNEIRRIYPSIELVHGHGLGVLCTGTKINPVFLDFVNQAKSNSNYLNLFQQLGEKITLLLETNRLENNWLHSHQKSEEFRIKYEKAMKSFEEVTGSLSWKVTAPFRRFSEKIRFKHKGNI